MKICIVIVTHDSAAFIDKCVVSIQEQVYRNFVVVIIDSGSTDTEYLMKYQAMENIDVVLGNNNIGFCRANNIGTDRYIESSDVILYLNPDAFLSKHALATAVHFLQSGHGEKTGIVGGKLLWYDLDQQKPTNKFDSTGIFQTWYGRWFDRGQMELDQGQYETSNQGEEVEAVCGAFMFCRASALIDTKLGDGEYFNNEFFIYKEDIDLSMRVSNAGWQVKYMSEICAWHCRGWQNRNKMSRQFKLLSARNEIQVNKKKGWIKLLYSCIKLLAVYCGI